MLEAHSVGTGMRDLDPKAAFSARAGSLTNDGHSSSG